MDWAGTATFGVGLTVLLLGITEGIQPYGEHSTGWTNPTVLGAIGLGLLLLMNFDYRLFALLLFLNGLGGGIFTAPNTAAIMSSVPAAQRGAASGVRATFFNAGSSPSIGIFLSLMVVGLAHTMPAAMSQGLQQQGVAPALAEQVATAPPVGSLFAAFLGHNPMAELLAPVGGLGQPGVNADVLTGTTFFPNLISGPFHAGLVVVSGAAALMMVIGAIASVFNPGRYSNG
jgi:hypothetical protein